VVFFRRKRETPDDRLPRESGVQRPGDEASAAPLNPLGRPPTAIPGVTTGGVEGVRAWDATTFVEDATLTRERYDFVAFADGSLVVGEDCDEDLSRLADSVELPPPFSAQALRQSGSLWAVGATPIEIVELPGTAGDSLTLSSVGGSLAYTVDGRETDPDRAPRALFELGEREGADYAVEAVRLDAALFTAVVSPL
jgi:hypothetical protein